MSSEIPEPITGERPTTYADRLGSWYSKRVSVEHKKRFGQFFTPEPVAHYMANLLQPREDMFRLLDPGSGTGILACAAAEFLLLKDRAPKHLEVEVYENDPDLVPILEKSLSFLKEFLADRDITCLVMLKTDDFVLTNGEALPDQLADTPLLFSKEPKIPTFDIVICNPPYFKIKKSDPRSVAASSVIHGQPNLYGLFMAVSAAILNPTGELVFITPRSFASGPYFSLFRERFFARMKPERIHIFNSRTDTFKRDEILQENVILKARRLDNWATRSSQSHIFISSSKGFKDFHLGKVTRENLNSILDMTSSEKVLHIPTDQEEKHIINSVRSWKGSLQTYGLQISTGRVVPFRALTFLRQSERLSESFVPLFWMNHVKILKIDWPIQDKKKPQYIQVVDESLPLLIPNETYVLMRRFSAKEERRRLVTAPFFRGRIESRWLGVENHLNYIHRPGGSLIDEEAMGLSIIYSSSVMDIYFRTSNGNTQVSATEIRCMPLPEREIILEIGRVAMRMSDPVSEIDVLVEEFLSIRPVSKLDKQSTETYRPVSEGVQELIAIG